MTGGKYQNSTQTCDWWEIPENEKAFDKLVQAFKNVSSSRTASAKLRNFAFQCLDSLVDILFAVICCLPIAIATGPCFLVALVSTLKWSMLYNGGFHLFANVDNHFMAQNVTADIKASHLKHSLTC